MLLLRLKLQHRHVNVHATVNDPVDPSDIGGVVASEKQDGRRHFSRYPTSLHDGRVFDPGVKLKYPPSVLLFH